MYSPFSPMIASSSSLDGSGGDAQVYGRYALKYLLVEVPTLDRWIGRGYTYIWSHASNVPR